MATDFTDARNAILASAYFDKLRQSVILDDGVDRVAIKVKSPEGKRLLIDLALCAPHLEGAPLTAVRSILSAWIDH